MVRMGSKWRAWPALLVIVASAGAVCGVASAQEPSSSSGGRAPAAEPDRAKASGDPKPGTAEPADLAGQLAAIGQGDWRKAFSIAQRIADLPPEQGWPIVRDAWPKLSDEAKQQTLKGWNFNTGFPLTPRTNHPHLLDLLDLGVRDPSPQVQRWAFQYLKPIAGQDFAPDFNAYKQWFEQNHARSPLAARADAMKAWIDRLAAARSREDFADAMGVARDMTMGLRSQPELARAAVDAGLIAALEPWIDRAGKAAPPREAAEAVQLLATLPLDRQTQERILLPLLKPEAPNELRSAAVTVLGRPGNVWAISPLETMMLDGLKGGPEGRMAIWDAARSLAAINDPIVIPAMIGAIDADNTYDTVYGIGYFGLTPLTGVEHKDTHDGTWWREWWEKNKERFPEAARSRAIPKVPKRPHNDRAPARKPGDNAAADPSGPVPTPADIADVRFQDITLAGNPNKRYFLIGPLKDSKPPEKGYRLIVILPGGEGNADFRPFIQRTLKNALRPDCIVAELVAPTWAGSKQIVWPTQRLKADGALVLADDFIPEVIKDAQSRATIDPKRIDAFGWSSGGPPVYTGAMMENSPLRGAFVAMSVYKPESLPPVTGAAGKRVYILHSPEDFIKMSFPEDAKAALAAAGAKVKLQTYDGGHGWHGDVFGMIRAGMDWLDGAE